MTRSEYTWPEAVTIIFIVFFFTALMDSAFDLIAASVVGCTVK